MRSFVLIVLFSFCVAAFFGCNDNVKNKPLLELLPPGRTGIDFINEIREDENLNILTFEYFYNGAGVGIGDFNNDSLPDIFFSSNMGSSRLYLNEGDFKFRDITESSGINTKGKWASGVSVVDINQDGFSDIYLSFAGPHDASKRANALYINNRDNSFTDKAAAYGLADTGHSVQAVFFDYDRDSDLDMYLLTNITDEMGPNIIRPKRNNGEMANTDRLYRNNGNETFTNVSRDAGITHEGYGLGVAVCDFNNDGWPDIFVSNDYVSNDLLYINNSNGTFTERSSAAFKHTSYSAMGNDVADMNNDGRPDIIEVDMLPPDNFRSKLMLGATNHDRYRSEIQYGYSPQFMRNTLHLNKSTGGGMPAFSEIAMLSGVAATDWSWSPLFADFDNDGWKDLMITNGYPRDITNRDFINYRAQNLLQEHNAESRQKKWFTALQQLDGALLHSFLFQNQGDLTYKDVSTEWGFKTSAYSSGAAYADLDRDGDLDVVIVNTGSAAGIYRNNAETLNDNHYLSIKLVGPSGNIDGYGARIKVFADSLFVYQEQYPVRGYQSTVGSSINIGLGKHKTADSVVVLWPDGKISRLLNVQAEQSLTIKYAEAGLMEPQPPAPSERLFEIANGKYAIHFKHTEPPYTDFNIQPLLPHKFSQSGPGIAVGDMNGDGLEDFFIGGAYHQSGELFFQQENGRFISRKLENERKQEEDLGVLLFDADNDRDLDLYIVSGGNEFEAGSMYYQDRLYTNNGKGTFTYDSLALPKETASGSCVVATDFDHDGDLDLFVGGKIVPQHYPEAGESKLLENNGGRFTDVTDAKAPALRNIGMVNAAIWSDINNDKWPDLILAGEWMPITVFVNEHERFSNATGRLGLEHTVGWWNSIQAGDFNRDGQIDFIAGNLGSNSRYTTTDKHPLSIYINDFGNIGNRNPIIAINDSGAGYPIHPRDDIMMQLPGLRKKFPLYADYAKARLTDLFTPEQLNKAESIQANTFQTVQVVNNGNKPWKVVPLCVEAQFAPVFGILVNDYDEDGTDDVLLTGNFYGAEVINGQYDAFKGLYLKGRVGGDFIVAENDFRLEGDGKGLAEIFVKGKSLILAATNNDTLTVFERKPRQSKSIHKMRSDDAYAILNFQNGKSVRREFYHGSGYLSSSGRYLHIPAGVRSVEVWSTQGVKRNLTF